MPAFEAEEFSLPQTERAFWGSPARRDDRIKTKVMSTDGFSINHNTVDLRYLEQLVDSEQTAALAGMMKYYMTKVTGPATVKRLAEMLERQMRQGGLEAFMDGYAWCGMAQPRVQEIYAMLNRSRRHL
ncbi:MAG: hypothetical protein LIO96_10845 [Lachnospiraceae bacterium]|nr:hypothetical protein [Lachnospiraceae bacterium]